MTLSKEQIDTLFAFTEKKLVRYYDLQVELVDHLAQKIEEEMAVDETLTFEVALQKVYASFGLFGFAHIVQEKQTSLQRKNVKLWFAQLKSFFTFPKLISTITLFLAAYFIGNMLSSAWRYNVVFASFTLFSIYQFYFFYKARKAIKKLMLLQAIPSSILFGPVLLYEQFLIFRGAVQHNLSFAIACVVAYVIQAAVIQVSKKVQHQAIRFYPDAFKFA